MTPYQLKLLQDTYQNSSGEFTPGFSIFHHRWTALCNSVRDGGLAARELDAFVEELQGEIESRLDKFSALGQELAPGQERDSLNLLAKGLHQWLDFLDSVLCSSEKVRLELLQRSTEPFEACLRQASIRLQRVKSNAES